MQMLMAGQGPGCSPRAAPVPLATHARHARDAAEQRFPEASQSAPASSHAAGATLAALAASTAIHMHAELDPASPASSHSPTSPPQRSSLAERGSMGIAALQSTAAPSHSMPMQKSSLMVQEPGKLPSAGLHMNGAGSWAAGDGKSAASQGGTGLKLASLRVVTSDAPLEEGWLWGPGDSPTVR